MKAQIISQIVYDGPIFGIERMGRRLKRIFIPDANNLIVAVDDGHLSVSDGFEKRETDTHGRRDCCVLEEIDISDQFVRKAAIFMEAKSGLLQTFKETIGISSEETKQNKGLVSVKRFRLKKEMTNDEVAKALGIYNHHRPGTDAVFFLSSKRKTLVGSRVNKTIFTLALSETDLHAKALKFADDIEES